MDGLAETGLVLAVLLAIAALVVGVCDLIDTATRHREFPNWFMATRTFGAPTTSYARFKGVVGKIGHDGQSTLPSDSGNRQTGRVDKTGGETAGKQRRQRRIANVIAGRLADNDAKCGKGRRNGALLDKLSSCMSE